MNPIRHFEVRGLGLAGLVKDAPATRRTAQQLSVMDNLRLEDGALATMPDPQEAVSFGARRPTWGMPFYLSDESGGHVVAFENDSIVFVEATGDEQTVTPDDLTTTENLYGCQVNDIFILTNGVDHPWQLTQQDLQAGGKFEPLENWPSTYRAGVFESFKSYCVAADITIDSVRNRSLVKWSHPLTPGDTGFYWDYTDPTLLAGENQLGVAGRDIVGLQPLRDNLIIYFDLAVWRMSNIGGDLVMGFTRLFTDDGAVGPNAFIDYDGRAIVLGHRDVYEHDGFSKVSLSDGKITRWLYDLGSVDRTTQASYHPTRREVYMLLHSRAAPAEGSRSTDAALVYNIDAQAFSLIRFPESASRLYRGPNFERIDWVYDDAEGTTYDETGRSYANIVSNVEAELFFILSPQLYNLRIMDAQSLHAHDPASIYAEVERIDLAPVFETTGDKMKFITRLFPQFEGAGQVQMSMGVAQTSAGPIEWRPWVDYDIVNDWAVDFRAAGRYLGLRLRNDPASPQRWSITGFDVEAMVPEAGRR